MNEHPSAFRMGVDEQSLFRSLHSAYPDALLIVDASGAIVLINEAAEKLLGYSDVEIVGMNVDRLVPDVSRARHASYRRAYGESPRARPMGTQMDLVALCKDGSEVMVEIALSPLTVKGIPLVVAAIRDVGMYPRVKQALLRARYAETLAQIGRDAVDSRDPQALLDRAPIAAADALDAAAAVVLLLSTDRSALRVAGGAGHALESVARVAAWSATTGPAAFVLAQGEPVLTTDLSTERRFEVPPALLGLGIRSMLGVPLFDRGRQIGVIQVFSTQADRLGDDETRFMQSLSNLVASALQRAQSEEALNHAQRLESVGQLTGGIAHDFNNLLTVIQGNLQVLQEMPSHADTPSQGLIDAATRAAKRGAELTGKLLAFSRRQVLKPSEVDVSSMLHSLSNMLHRTLDQRIKIDVEVTGSPVVQADAGQLESALLNIAINARDAMLEGGRLRFSCRTIAHLPEDLRPGLDENAPSSVPFVAITVQDSGTGMTEAVKERAFEPFFTTKGAGRGTGLGLSTVYGFARQSKGTVAIDSTPGNGTAVTLYIPCAEASGANPPVKEAAAAVLPLGLKVLVVEDDPEVRRVVEAFLDALGCETTTSRSAEEAIPRLLQDRPFDVLLSDISLGAGMRGTELAVFAQQRNPTLAILLMSGFSSELLEADRSSPASWEFLGKPFSREELGTALAGVLANRAC
ncbi:MAG: PAS domain S-box protein [Rubrivivax sp.]